MNDSRRKPRQHEILAARVDTRCVALVRGSTETQQLTLSAQETTIRRYCELKQWELAKVFTDSGTCGKTVFLDRDVVRDMLRFMQAEGIANIICTRLDRAFRNQGDSIITLDRLFNAGVFMHFAEQSIDPTTPTGRAMFGMLGVFAELESNIRSERQLDAFDEQRRRGQKSGVNVPFGWKAVPSPGRLTKERRAASDLVVVPEQQQILGEILRRHAEGESDEHIAAVLNRAGIPTAKSGQMIRWKGREQMAKGKWSKKTVFSVRSFARLADTRLTSDNPDEVEDAVEALATMRSQP